MPGAKSKSAILREVTSSGRVAQALVRQKQREKLDRQRRRAEAVIRSFRVKKADKGKYHFIGTDGKRGASNKGRAGYMMYVTKGGKKKPVKNFRSKEPFRPVKVTNFKLKHSRTLKTPQKEFTKSQLELTTTGNSVNRGGGSVDVSGTYDFSDKVVRKIAKSIQTVINRQQSRRSFIIQANVLVELPDGRSKVYEVLIPIAKQDRDFIELAGVNNFVQRKFYAYMARQIAYDGYVTSGSANHIRRLGTNQGEEKENWKQDDGETWRGNESEIVKIKRIEWKMYQAK